ncbi:hypothetical protein BgiBS90_027131, partial [Biomphalaria glabrata]
MSRSSAASIVLFLARFCLIDRCVIVSIIYIEATPLTLVEIPNNVIMQRSSIQK